MKALTDNLPLVAGGGLLSLALVFGGGIEQFQSNAERSQQLKVERQANADELVQIQIDEDRKRQQALIADSRYEEGCVLVVASFAPGQFTSITEGEPVMDSAHGVPLSDGSIVCDVHGLTGVIEGGVVAKTPFTGNREVINQAIDRSQIAAEQLTPGVD
ncbi:MAG: hypothetical protein ACFB5Z_11190 [Elainellaceae cyanobacterium]